MALFTIFWPAKSGNLRMFELIPLYTPATHGAVYLNKT